jgi:GntR family transcriptional regulator
LIIVEVPQINYRSPESPHRQIAAWLRAQIQAGDLAPDDPLPSEKDLIDLFGVARTTVRRAVAYLRDQGVVYTVAGRGTFVTRKG